jgi:4-hydroxy-tetrahydrodipicolinate synthase
LRFSVWWSSHIHSATSFVFAPDDFRAVGVDKVTTVYGLLKTSLESLMQRHRTDLPLIVRGVFAAMTIPRSPHGGIDLDSFAVHLRHLRSAGIQGFVLNGATGEYCLTESAELGAMVARARQVVGPHTTLVAAIGGASLQQVLQRLHEAERQGVEALLLPMPHFFPYAQQDLEAFAQQVAAQTNLPILLYNLPSFTTPIEAATTLRLLSASLAAEGRQGGLVGIKDSSGSLDTVRLLSQKLPVANRVIGSDNALYAAVVEGLCDGVVSGVACVLPELMLALYSRTQLAPTSEATLALRSALDEFIEWLGRFPVPWGLKIIAMERGLSPLDLPLPLSEERSATRDAFLAWFREHRHRLLADELFG